MRFEIIEVHVVDIPDDECREMEDSIEEIKDDAPWFIRQYGCDEVRRLGGPFKPSLMRKEAAE